MNCLQSVVLKSGVKKTHSINEIIETVCFSSQFFHHLLHPHSDFTLTTFIHLCEICSICFSFSEVSVRKKIACIVKISPHNMYERNNSTKKKCNGVAVVAYQVSQQHIFSQRQRNQTENIHIYKQTVNAHNYISELSMLACIANALKNRNFPLRISIHTSDTHTFNEFRMNVTNIL